MRRLGGMLRASVGLAALAAVACGGGGGGGSGGSGFRGGSGFPAGARSVSSPVMDPADPGGGETTQPACDGGCSPSADTMDERRVRLVVNQAAAELRARGFEGMVAVADRAGNPLMIWSTLPSDVRPVIRITSRRPATARRLPGLFGNGLEDVDVVPAEAGALSKAITGAYLSSQGNAFSTRTANFIVNANFPPNNSNELSGPLSGVQFSQLTCGDWVRRITDNTGNGPNDARPGPKRAPLGFSADPGGFPLYIDGIVVGGIGVVAFRPEDTKSDGTPVSIYGVDGSPEDSGRDLEEEVAMAAMRGFEAPENRMANRLSVMGRLLRYSNSGRGGNAMTAPLGFFPADLPTGGSVRSLPGFYDGTAGVIPGVAFGTVQSGIVPADGSVAGGPVFGTDENGRAIQAQILVNPDGTPYLGRNSGVVTNPRNSLFPPGANGGPGLQAPEVRNLIDRALNIAQLARAQIRSPLGSFVQVNVHVCDREGNQLGYARTPDAPLFGSDVALQKCRAAAFFSRGSTFTPPGAGNGSDPRGLMTAADLLRAEDQRFVSSGRSRAAAILLSDTDGIRNTTMTRYLTNAQSLLGPQAFANGTAFSNRAFGNLARPCFPDGVNCVPDGLGGVNGGSTPPQGFEGGPFSVDGDRRNFSPLSVGFQLEYVKDAVVDGLLSASISAAMPAMAFPEPTTCGGLSANGFQIFAGAVPVYKRDANGNVYHAGAIGISGDGIDQDDMVAFLGTDRASMLPGSMVMNAPRPIRADAMPVGGSGNSTSLRFVNCPVSPFNPPNDSAQNVCEGR